jgi:hypothetical protein
MLHAAFWDCLKYGQITPIILIEEKDLPISCLKLPAANFYPALT